MNDTLVAKLLAKQAAYGFADTKPVPADDEWAQKVQRLETAFSGLERRVDTSIARMNKTLNDMATLIGQHLGAPAPVAMPGHEITSLRDEVRMLRKIVLTVHDLPTRVDDLAALTLSVSERLDLYALRPAVAGTFPPVKEIEKLYVQVFHTVDLTSKEMMAGFTEWSLKVEYWHRGKRQPAIDLGLDPKPKWLKLCGSKKAPADLIAIAEGMPNESLGGFVRRHLSGGGRAYTPNQSAMLHDRDGGQDRVSVVLWIEGDMIQLDHFRKSAGTKPGKSLWFESWKPPSI